MARCGCSGGAGNCGCVISDGLFTQVRGTGTQDSPYVVDLPPDFFSTLQTPQTFLVTSGTGQPGSPLGLAAYTTGSPSERYVGVGNLTTTQSMLDLLGLDPGNSVFRSQFKANINASPATISWGIPPGQMVAGSEVHFILVSIGASSVTFTGLTYSPSGTSYTETFSAAGQVRHYKFLVDGNLAVHLIPLTPTALHS